jgi:hypothetical protein
MSKLIDELRQYMPAFEAESFVAVAKGCDLFFRRRNARSKRQRKNEINHHHARNSAH